MTTTETNKEANKEWKKFYDSYTKRKTKSTEKFKKEFSQFSSEWIAKYSPYKVFQVLEILKNNQFKSNKYKRMVIYDIGGTIMDGTILLMAYGWWLNDNNEPVKWNGNGFPILNCKTSFEMCLSENQTHIVREEYAKSIDFKL